MHIQWFPGHMTKTRRQIQDTISQVDVVIELLDARIPLSSRNPDIDWLVGHKPRVVALNKSDLADEAVSRQWEAFFRAQGIEVIYTNALSGAGLKEIHKRLRALTASKLESAMRRGRLQRPIRTMVVGIPNVGKSAFINRIAGKAIAQTGDKPGVTRSQQWVRIHPEIQLLDTPGILWPKFEDQETGLVLAFTGAVKDDIMDTTELASLLLARLAKLYPARITERYKLSDVSNRTGMDLLLEAGRRRGCLIAGGEVDLHRISAIVLDEFRGAKLGRMSLEKPPRIIPSETVAAVGGMMPISVVEDKKGMSRSDAEAGATADESAEREETDAAATEREETDAAAAKREETDAAAAEPKKTDDTALSGDGTED